MMFTSAKSFSALVAVALITYAAPATAVCSSGQIATGNTLPFEIQPVRFLDLLFECKF